MAPNLGIFTMKNFSTKYTFLFFTLCLISFSAHAAGGKSLEQICTLPEENANQPLLKAIESKLASSDSCSLSNTGCNRQLERTQPKLCSQLEKSANEDPLTIKGTFKCFSATKEATEYSKRNYNCENDSGNNYNRCSYQAVVYGSWKAKNITKISDVDKLDKKLDALSACIKSARNDDELMLLVGMQKTYLQQKEDFKVRETDVQEEKNTATTTTSEIPSLLPKDGNVINIDNPHCSLTVDPTRKIVLREENIVSGSDYSDMTNRYFSEETGKLCANLRERMNGDDEAIKETFSCKQTYAASENYGYDSISPLWIFGPRISFTTSKYHPAAEAEWKRVRAPLTELQILDEKMLKLNKCISGEKNDLALIVMDAQRTQLQQLRKALSR